MVAPLQVTLYDKAFKRLGWIGDPEQVTVVPRHNQQPTASIQVANDHPRAADLVTPGCRVVVDYYGEQILSGPVDLSQGAAGSDGSITVQVQDDWCVLTDILGLPAPTKPLSAQTGNGGEGNGYDVRSGPAETVLKGYVRDNAAAMGLSWLTVAPDLGRGSVISVQMRLTSLADQLVPLLDGAGIGVSVRQVDGGLVLDCYTPGTYPLVLTPGSGIVASAEWSLQRPAFTRYVAGGQGDQAARALAEYVDTAAESLWGTVRRGFVDATDVTTTADLVARAQQATVEAAAKSGFSLSLAETASFRYGQSFRVGDQITVQLVPGADPVTDVLREATISWSADNGLTVTPTVGERTDDPNLTLAMAIRSTASRLARTLARR